ncbi:hypothetical protein B5S32_g1661 [[Candida] boidinii]|nr:hypothetical protein B5S32_g1661 [[Candida] boidinii]
MFLNQKKQRLLGITACLITLILVISLLNKENSINSNSNFNIPNISVDDVSSKTNANNLVKDNSGHIDESKVRLVEEEAQRQVQKKKQEAVAAGSGSGSGSGTGSISDDKDTNILKDSNSKDIIDTADTKKKPIDKDLLDDSMPPSHEKSNVVNADKTDKAIDDTQDVSNTNKLKNSDTKDLNSNIKNSKKINNNISDDDNDLILDEDEDDEQSVLRFDPIKEFNEILSMSPVVIFSKSYCPYSKKLKNLLTNSYEITPQPTIVELDLHRNGVELQKYIGEVSGRKTVPNLFVAGQSRGGCDEMIELHSENKLLKKLQFWGSGNVKVNKVNAPSNS